MGYTPYRLHCSDLFKWRHGKSFLLSDNPVWLAPRDCQPTVPGIVASSSGHLKKVNFQWVGLDRSYKNPFDIADSSICWFLFFIIEFKRWCFHVDAADCSVSTVFAKVQEKSKFPILPATPDMMTIHFYFFLKICQNLVLDNFIRRNLLDYSNIYYDFFPCCFLLFFIFDKPFDVALRTVFEDSSAFQFLVQTGRKMEISIVSWCTSALWSESYHRMKAIFISYYLVCVNPFIELKSTTSSGLSSINSPTVIQFLSISSWLIPFFELVKEIFKDRIFGWNSSVRDPCTWFHLYDPLSVWSGRHMMYVNLIDFVIYFSSFRNIRLAYFVLLWGESAILRLKILFWI